MEEKGVSMNSMLKDLTIQDFLAVIVSVGVFTLIILKIPVPENVWSAWTMVIVFFFNQDKKNGNGTPTPKLTP